MPTTTNMSSNRLLVRWGTVVLVLGFLFSLAGAAMLGQGPGPLETPGDFFHQLGKYTMLAGLIMVLGGYRWPQIRAVFDDSVFAGPQAPRPRLADVPPRHPETTTGTSLGTGILLAGSIFIGLPLALAAVFVLPVPAAYVVAIVSFLTIAATLIVVSCFGRGAIRAFAIAALVPTTFFLWASIELLFLFGRGFWVSGMRGHEAFRWLTVFAWLIILGLGILGMLVRRVVTGRK